MIHQYKVSSIGAYAARLLLFSSLLLLSGCDIVDKITELISGAKGQRAISFVIVEPYQYELNDDNEYKKDVGFSNATATLEQTFKDGVAQAAGNRSWSTLWYPDRKPILAFYEAWVAAQQKDTDNIDAEQRKMLRDFMLSVRASDKPDLKRSEAVIFSLVGTHFRNGKEDPNFPSHLIIAFCFDVIENKMVYLARPIPTDTSAQKYKEDMADLVARLCEKMYGNK